MNNLIPWRKHKGEDTLSTMERPASLFHRHMNDLMSDFFREFEHPWGLSTARDAHWILPVIPSVEVSETEDEVQVTAELPGMTEKDIEVALEDDTLILRGEKKQEHEEKKRNYHMVERSYGEFHRALPLPAGVDPNKVKAKFKDGVLKVTLAKTPQAKESRKTIKVQTDE